MAEKSLRAAEDPRVLKAGVIGVGGYGMVDAKAALKVGGVEIAAVCDVDSQHLKSAADTIAKLQGRRPRAFKLYEEMLDKADLDFVIIASPPHWHALHLIAALDHGLPHCFEGYWAEIYGSFAPIKLLHNADNLC